MSRDISTKEHLAHALGTSPAWLDEILAHKTALYRPFRRLQRNGKIRVIDRPVNPLKLIQRRVYSIFFHEYVFAPNVHGGVKRKSIFSAAAPHVRRPAVATVDILNFYPSITQSVVFHLFLREFRCSRPVARILAELTTHDGRLPQGSPVSLAIANAVMAPADLEILLRLSLFARRVEYTRWVDDLIFSGHLSDVATVFDIVADAVRGIGLKVHRRKSRLMPRHVRQFALGLVLNDRITIPRLDRRRVRAGVSNWLRYRKGRVARVVGRVEFIRTCHPRLADSLAAQLPRPARRWRPVRRRARLVAST